MLVNKSLLYWNVLHNTHIIKYVLFKLENYDFNSNKRHVCFEKCNNSYPLFWK